MDISEDRRNWLTISRLIHSIQKQIPSMLMKSLKRSMKSYVKTFFQLANAQALITATRKPTNRIYVHRVNSGIGNSEILIKREKILRGIKTAKAHSGLKITGRWQNTLCLHLDLHLVLSKMLNLPTFLHFSTYSSGRRTRRFLVKLE